MDLIPDDISYSESLTHALYFPVDINKNTMWAKAKTFMPPKKTPSEVSFNRACYMPDREQKRIAGTINRMGSEHRGFVRMSKQNLQNAKSLLIDKGTIAQSKLDKVNFIYSPIYDRTNYSAKWPKNETKIWGVGFNPAHADLKFDDIEQGKSSETALVLSRLLGSDQNDFCEVILENEDDYKKDDWKGRKLCISN